MGKFTAALLAGAAITLSFAPLAHAKDKIIGVSWSNFQEDRWKTDEAAIKKQLEADGDKYISADAQSSAEKQLSDIESLISRGARVLIVVAQDGAAVKPAVADAIKRGVQVIAYDRLIDDPKTLYVSFDNVEVGRMQARAVLAAKPVGNYAFIKGDRDTGLALYMKGTGEMDHAVELQPQSVAVRIPRGAVYLVMAHYVPEPEKTKLLERGISDYEATLSAQQAYFSTLSLHAREQLLYGLTDGYAMAGQTDKARTTYERMRHDAAGSELLTRAAERAAGHAVAGDTPCEQCHAR